MKAVIKQKVLSALCNDDQVDKYNKAMYQYVKWDPVSETNVIVEDSKFT